MTAGRVGTAGVYKSQREVRVRLAQKANYKECRTFISEALGIH